MKHKTINHELLLISGTSYNRRQFITRDSDSKSGPDHSVMEDMEKKCRDGKLNELLPELAGYPSRSNRNFIWNIASGVHFLSICMGTCPMPDKNETSIDPHFILSSILYN
jgi:hypothetical protein